MPNKPQGEADQSDDVVKFLDGRLAGGDDASLAEVRALYSLRRSIGKPLDTRTYAYFLDGLRALGES